METRLPEVLTLLRTGGWVQGTMRTTRHEHCLMGALYSVWSADTTPQWWRHMWRDRLALCQVIGEQYPNVALRLGEENLTMLHFNDYVAQCLADVERVVEKAQLLREESKDFD